VAAYDRIAATLCDLLPQGSMPNVKHGGGAAEVRSAPHDEYAEAVDLGELYFVEPAPFAARTLEPLKLQKSPDSDFCFVFCETRQVKNHDRRGSWRGTAFVPSQARRYASFVLKDSAEGGTGYDAGGIGRPPRLNRLSSP
jgi:hypothetical protein